MLIIDGNSVYEIDEECVRKKKVPKECGIYEKMMQQQNREKDREYAARDPEHKASVNSADIQKRLFHNRQRRFSL